MNLNGMQPIGLGDIVYVSTISLVQFSNDIRELLENRRGEVTGPITDKEAWIDFPALDKKEAVNFCLKLTDLVRVKDTGIRRIDPSEPLNLHTLDD